jgi:2-polyprenyl-3-methyl-5-hydroxy-6-metoxy-1,4-benzoquinol methylase
MKLATIAGMLGRKTRIGPVQSEVGSEKSSEYYDGVFHSDGKFHGHYAASPYYCVWTVILDRIRRIEHPRILEIGCGTGQLAKAIHDSGLAESYLGFDFSPVAVRLSKERCPELDFGVADALETDLYRTADYNTVISTEFLEHVERDTDVISAIKPGTWFVGTVPNFPYRSHARHFRDAREVIDRYARFFEPFEVLPVLLDEGGATVYLMQGKTKPL